MEAGYDYLLLRSRLQRKLSKNLGLIAVVVGVLLLAGGAAYYGYAEKARADLSDLNVTAPAAAPVQASPSVALPQRTGAPTPADSAGTATVSSGSPALSGGEQAPYSVQPPAFTPISHPWVHELPAHQRQMLQLGFSPVAPFTTPPVPPLDTATRIIVPSVGIDSTIEELEILELGDSRAYETPDRVVGHIPETVNPGEPGAAWFFGHTESPTMGEGSVFFDLRQVPGKLRSGEEVFIITDNGHHQYLYRVTSSQVVHQDDLRLYDTDEATIHLVACVPRWVYDHRLIISGELLGQKTNS